MVTLVPGKSCVIDIGKESRKTNALQRGRLVFLAEVGQRLVGLGGGDNRPVNPVHFREGTSCFSLKWKNDWWD